MLKRVSAVLSDNLIRVLDLVDEDTGSYVNDATVICTVVTSAGGVVLGQTWPLALVYKPASNGEYRGVLQDDVIMVAGTYVARITATVPSGLKHYWEIEFVHLIDVGPRA